MNDTSRTPAPAILVVDDEPALRSAIAFDFELRGYRVLEAENGGRALDVLASDGHVGLVLTDVLMPVMGGVALLDRIRAHPGPQPAVIVLTGYSELTLQEALHRGAEALFSKPFDRAELAAAVDRFLLPPETRWRRPNPAARETSAATMSAPMSATMSAPMRLELHLDGDVSKSDAADFRLGRGGFFVSQRHTAHLHTGQEVEFLLRMSDAALEGRGRVAWIRNKNAQANLEAGAGIEFLELSEESLQEVLKRFRRNPPRATIPKA